MIEIAVSSRGHDHIMSHLHRFDAAFRTSPGHDRSSGGKSSVQDLVPADYPPSLRLHETAHAADHIALKFIDILQSLVFHSLLALRA